MVYKLGIAIYTLEIVVYKLGIAIYTLEIVVYNLGIAIYTLKIVVYNLGIAIYTLEIVVYNLGIAIYTLEIVVIYSVLQYIHSKLWYIIPVSINQSNFIYKALKNTEVDQSAVQRNNTHTRHKIEIKHIKKQ